MAAPGAGVHLTPGADRAREIDVLNAVVGPPVGLEAVLAGASRRAGPARLGRVLGRAVTEAFSWDAEDARDPRWWPQGVSSSADASADEHVAGRALLVTTSYARPVGGTSHGCRVTFVDLATLRYDHVLLVLPGIDDRGAPTLAPVRAHAGGIAWHGSWLHVAATAKGLVSARVEDVLAAGAGEGLGVVDGRVAAYGHRFVLPVRLAHRAGSDPGHEGFRHSFVSLDRSEQRPALVTGEYARRGRSRRLARYEVDPGTGLPLTGDDGTARPVEVADGVEGMQGAVVHRGRHLISTSHGPWLPGSIWSGRPDDLRRHPLAVPMGPEDLTRWPSTGRVWTVTEHPRRRWFLAVREDRLA